MKVVNLNNGNYHGFMKRAINYSLFLALALASTGCTIAFLDEDSSAERLVVEAVEWLNQARDEPDPQRQLDLIAKVETNLTKVIDRYPGSDAAVKFAAGQSVGVISLEIVANEKARYESSAFSTQAENDAAACFAAPNRNCLLVQALAAALGITNAKNRAWKLVVVAHAQTEAGYPGKARQAIAWAMAAVDEIGDASAIRALVLVELASERARVGDAKKALATAKEISDTDERALALARIAGIQAEAGELRQARQSIAEALVAVNEINYIDDRALRLHQIAAAQVKVGDVT